jgi:hypothetical protein
MSTLLAPGNTLERMLGIDNYTEWEFWVFKKTILKEEDESEDFWLERLTHTATAIEDQIEFIEQDESLPRTEKLNEIKRLKSRLFQFHNEVGEIPTFKGWEGKYDAELKSTRNNLVERKVTRENNFRKFIRLYIKDYPDASIDDVWRFLHRSVGEELYDLIEVKEVTGFDKISQVRWINYSTGEEGQALKRQSVSQAISEIRKTEKN